MIQNLLWGPQFTDPPGPPKITAGQEAEIGWDRARVIPGGSPPLEEGGPGRHPGPGKRAPRDRGPQGRAHDQHEGGERGQAADGGLLGAGCARRLCRVNTHMRCWEPGARLMWPRTAAPTHPSGQHAAAQEASRSSGAPRRPGGGVPVHTCAEGARRVLVLPHGVRRRPGRGRGPRRPQRAGAGAGGLGGQRALASSQALLREGVLVGHT